MKKLVLGTIAALVATASLSTVADAGWHHHHHNHWNNGWNGGIFFGGPRIVVRPAYYDDYCYVKKIKRYDDFGNVWIKRVRVCG